MNPPANAVYVYTLTTDAAEVREASVEANCLAIIERRSEADQIIWTVAATADQGLGFRRLPWVIAPRQRGMMQLEEDDYVFRDRKSGEILSISAEAFARGE